MFAPRARDTFDVDKVAELLGGDRGDPDGDGAVAVVGDPFVRFGVLEFSGSSKASS